MLCMGTSRALGINGRTARLICLAASLWCVGAASPAQHRPKAPPAVLHFTGRFVGFVEADYQWANFCVGGDSLVGLGISHSEVAWFLAAHAGAQVDVDARIIGADTTEAGVIEPDYGLEGASINGYTSEAWWSAMERSLGYERASTFFNALQDSLTALDEPDCKHLSLHR